MSRNKRFIYVGVLVLAGGGFLIDRLFLGKPAPAAANTLPQAARRAPIRQTPTAPAEKQPPNPENDPAIAWLDRIETLPVSRDVFTPSPDMLMYYKLTRDLTEGDANAKAPQQSAADVFRDQHQLQGTLVRNGIRLAVVDGEVLRQGELLDGFCLDQIKAYSAEFFKDGVRVTLHIALPKKTD